MTTLLFDHFGKWIDLGACLAGRNLNLLVFRGYAPIEFLSAVSAPSIYDQEKNPYGTQRDVDKTHSQESYEYARGSVEVLADDDPRAFPEIILNVRDENVIEIYEHGNPDDPVDLDSFTAASEFDGGVVGVRIRTDKIDFPHLTANPQISRVDGNHRLSSVDIEALLSNELEDFVTVPFCIYMKLNPKQELKLFRDINGSHKGMDVSFLITTETRLGGDSLKNDPSTVHIWIANKLAAKEMAFDGVVFRGGSKAGTKEKLGKVPPIRIASLASTMKTLLTSAQVLRSSFSDQPEAIFAVLNRYWMAVKTVFPEAWGDKTNFILLQTIGLTGFARLGAVLIDQAIQDGKASQKDFEVYLKVVRNTVDLNRKSWDGVAGAGGGRKVGDVLIQAATQSAANVQKIIDDISPPDDPTSALD